MDRLAPPYRAISLCAGIGGIDLGLKAAIPGYTTIAYVEREAFCAGILAARMQEGFLDAAPVWSDLRTFDGKPWRGAVDLVTAGYPCQPWSLAGKRGGQNDPRHLWPHIARIIEECCPAVVFLENVPGHVSLGLRDVCADLRSLGYAVSAGIFSAEECGAPHQRKRLFVLASADTNGQGRLQQEGLVGEIGRRLGDGREEMADADYAQRRGDGACNSKVEKKHHSLSGRWEQGNGQFAGCGHLSVYAGRAQKRRTSQPAVGRAAHGLPGWVDDQWENGVPRSLSSSQPDRIDRLTALGNAVVPATARLAWDTLSQDSKGLYQLTCLTQEATPCSA